MAVHVPDYMPLPSGLPPKSHSLHRPPVVVIQCIPSNHQYFALFGQRTEDVSRLLPTDTNLGAIDEKLHVHAIVRDCYVRPLVRNVASVGVDGGHFVSAVGFEGEEEARVTVPMLTYGLDAQQPASVTGGVETFVIKAWKEKENKVRVCKCST